MGTTIPEDTALEFVDRINSQDVDGLGALMSENFRFIDMEGEVTQGPEVMRKGWGEYFSAYPQYKIHVSTVARSGDDVAIIGKTTGSHVPPDIESRETVIFIAKIEGGSVAEWRIYSDLERVKKSLEERFRRD